jgi:hypothetical protein
MSHASVPRYSRVSTSFWSDNRSASWPDDVKLFALYVITAPHRTLEGIFLLPIPYASADLHWSMKKVTKAIGFLTQAGFLYFDGKTSTLLIRNALRYQAPENENQAKPCLRRIASLPISDLLPEFLILAKQHCYRAGASPFAQAFYQLLEKQFAQQLVKPFDPLNLQSESLTEPKTLNLQPRRNGDQEGDFYLPQGGEESERGKVGKELNGKRDGLGHISELLPRAEQELLRRHPHLKETS